MRIAVTALISLLLTGSPVGAATILSSYCRIGLPDGGEIVASSSSDCSVMGPLVEPYRFPPSAEASAYAHYGFYSFEGEPEIPEGTFSAFVRVTADARGVPLEWTNYSNARAEAELSFRGTTAGPVRPGLIQFFNLGHGEGLGYGDFQGQWVVGDFVGNIYEFGGCLGDCFGETTVPFVLGDAFDIRLAAVALGWADRDGSGAASGDLYLQFKLRELDGTPVDLILDSETAVVVPEPSTFLMLLPALIFLVLARLSEAALTTDKVAAVREIMMRTITEAGSGTPAGRPRRDRSAPASAYSSASIARTWMDHAPIRRLRNAWP
jgi:hypothetical protein